MKESAVGIQSQQKKDSKIGIAIVGGSGFSAGELLRLLANHPLASIASVVSRSRGAEVVTELHPQLSGVCDQIRLSEQFDYEVLLPYERRVVFLGLPHGESANFFTAELESLGRHQILAIDLSGDLRLRDPGLHQQFYPHSPRAEKLASGATYGLTELYREQIKGSLVIANPGCYPTATALALVPLLRRLTVDQVNVTALSGTSGGGRALNEKFHHPTRHASVTSYGVLEHRHEPEILQTLWELGMNKDLGLTFVPHLIPTARGIFMTAHLRAQEQIQTAEAVELFKEQYRGERFIRIREGGVELRDVIGSNFCDIKVTARPTKSGQTDLVVSSVIDNLIKGAAGQAIQNMNLALGLPEETGLLQAGLGLI